ncbi:MAG: cyclopropane-fatty-acyl-phospholipid synthase family protein [Cyanobacteria bacterium P01_F01_bin.150]
MTKTNTIPNSLPTQDQLSQTVMDLIIKFIEPCENDEFAIELWNGQRWDPTPEKTRATLIIRDPGAIRTLLFSGGTLALAELYMGGRVDIVGEIEAMLPLVDYLITLKPKWSDVLPVAVKLLKFSDNSNHQNGQISHEPAVVSGDPKSRQRVGDAIKYHYDQPSEFWQLWLDPYMQYTCAYFQDEDDDLATAQLQKMDYICRKLRLQPGDRFLDLGCGWGGLAVYAAKHYQVQSVGITISKYQAEYAQNWIKREGLDDICRVELGDFRDALNFEKFDKVAGVGILEHLTSHLINEYFETAWTCLNPGGIFLNHATGSVARQPTRKGKSFMHRYIFPNTELIPINDVLAVADRTGFEIRDLENLREHYRLTLIRWLKNFEANSSQVLEFMDKSAYRAYQLYFVGCIYDFNIGRNNLYQSLYVKPKNNKSGMPLSRAYLYKGMDKA